MDIKKVLEKIDEMTAHKHHPVQEIRDWDKIDLSGDNYDQDEASKREILRLWNKEGFTIPEIVQYFQKHESDVSEEFITNVINTYEAEDEWEEDYIDDQYSDEYGDIDFSRPGSGSALRAATNDNPRNRPCPTCGREDVLTRKDVQLGYQCDRCADAMERGIDIYETKNKKSLKDYIAETQENVDETVRLGFSTKDDKFKRPATTGQRSEIAKAVKDMRKSAKASNVAAQQKFGQYDDPESMGAPPQLPTRGIASVTGNPASIKRNIKIAKTGVKDRGDPLYVPGVVGTSAGKKVTEADQIQVVPANQKAMLIKQGDKTLGTVTNPGLAQQIKQSIGKGEMTLAGSKLGEDTISEEALMSFQTKDEDDSSEHHRMADVFKQGDDFVVIFKTMAPGVTAPNPLRTKDASQAEKAARKYTGNDTMNEAKKPKEPFAIGMAAAKKAAGIKKKHATDLPKSVIKKGHKIGKEIAKQEKLDEKWAGDAKVEPTGEYADKSKAELKSMLAKLHKSGPHKAGSPEAKKQRQINFALRAKGGWKKGEGAAMKEAEIPSSGPDFGAGLGAGRSQETFESKKTAKHDEKAEKAGKKVTKDLEYDMKKSTKKKVKESVDSKLKAAYQEGYAHGLREQSCRVKHYEDMEEARKYYEGYKIGLDECYGMVPIQGVVVGEGDGLPPATVPGMADQAMEGDGIPFMQEDELGEEVLMDAELDEMMRDLDEMNRTEYMKHKAETTPGDTFKAFGQEFKDTEVLEDDAFAFESLDNQLNALLESADPVTEGLSVSMSTGQPGMQGDSVSVTATDDDAGKLLDFVKKVALGGMGPEEAHPEAHAVVAKSDYGAPSHTPDDHDGMLAVIKKMTGGDYEQEADHEHSSSCGCEDSAVHEEQTEDQMAYEVAEDAAEDAEVEMTDHDEDAEAKEDEALAIQNVKENGSANEGAIQMFNKGIKRQGSLLLVPFDVVGETFAINAEDEQGLKQLPAALKEFGMPAQRIWLNDMNPDKVHIQMPSETHAKRAEQMFHKLLKKPIYNEETEENLTEWANEAGKKGTEETFETDIDFMTQFISGGLNKPKSTGQTTIPVVAGQKSRMGADSLGEAEDPIAQWQKLSGIK